MISDERKEAIDKAVDLLMSQEKDISKIMSNGSMYKELTKRLVEKTLQAEMGEHLGYKPYEQSDSSNSRNGFGKKEVITEHGTVSIEVPRDREGDFKPVFVPKRKNRIDGIDQKILSLYAKGMSLSDIKIQLLELYGAEVSESLISRVTDNVLEDVIAWQNRPLDSVCPIVYFDCLMLKVRQDKCIINKAIYVALGIELSGKKDVLGLWISDNDGAKFWLNNLTELKNRELQDILIACTDNLTGMSGAIAAVYPKTEHQLCIVHQIRNSLKYVSYKDRKEVVADLKLIYTSFTEDAAHEALASFAEKWDKQYPQISKSWYSNWENLIIFLSYSEAIKKIIYTTNSIESVNSQFQKVTKNKRVFPNDSAVFKTLYLTIEYITAKWNMPVHNWNEAMAHFLIKFDERIRGC
jgi:transposase-like protein